MDTNDITILAKTNFRNRDVPFGIRTDDRRRHTYIIGKTGMGKTTLMENMIIQDIVNGKGVAFVDPHGDSVEKILDFIPSSRVNDVIYINPADVDFPIAFNILESVNAKYKHLVASGLMGVFTKIWANLWSARMEYILNNSILALLDSPGNTLLGIARLLVDKRYRKKILDNVKDPMVRTFWMDEFANWPEKYRMEAIAPIQNKVGQFLSSGITRNIVGQPKSTLDLREAMDSKKIILMNLSKGRVGEDNSALLGAMIITKLQLAALSRVDVEESEREDFYLYVDEFQNFATESFATILSEARKYRLNLTIGHQYIGQLISDKNTSVRDAVFGNVGTIISFRVGAADAEFLEKEFEPTFMQNDLVNLPRATVVLRLMINGVASDPFTAVTLPPGTYERTGNADKVVRVSRERYANPVAEVEEKITRWMGGDDVRENTAAIASHAKIEGREDDEEEDGDAKTAAPAPLVERAERLEPARQPVAPAVRPAQRAPTPTGATVREVPAKAYVQAVAAKPFAPVLQAQTHRPPMQRPQHAQHSQHRTAPPVKRPSANPIWDQVAQMNQQRAKQPVHTESEIEEKFFAKSPEQGAKSPEQGTEKKEEIKPVLAAQTPQQRNVLRPGESQKVDDFGF